LRQLTKLESLTFSGVSFGPKYKGIWQEFSTLTSLRTMSIDHNSIFESKYVAKLKHLSSLSLSVLNPINHLWDRPTYHVFNAADLPSLTALKIDYTVHPCQGLDTITTLTNLGMILWIEMDFLIFFISVMNEILSVDYCFLSAFFSHAQILGITKI
jgi:hypothetical protein